MRRREGLSLTFVNVGYGEAMLLDLNGGSFTMLVDGGSNEREEYEGNSTGRMELERYLGEQGVDRLDLVVCTHIHEDHISGLVPLFRRVKPGEFWQNLPVSFHRGKEKLTNFRAETISQRKFLRALNDYLSICEMMDECHIPIVQAAPPLTISHEGLTIRVIGPSPQREEDLERLMASIWGGGEGKDLAFLRADLMMNNYSIMMMVEYAGRRIFLPGDTNRDGFRETGKERRADIFKVGHHGQGDAITREIFRTIKAEAVVCCASSDRRYQSADPTILSMMEEEGATLYFSDCPNNRTELRPHKALTFTISPEGAIMAGYIPT